MHSAIRVLDMDRASPIGDDAKAQAAFRKCVIEGCHKRMPDRARDGHTICPKCRGKVCDLFVKCDECANWSMDQRKAFASYAKSLARRSKFNQRKRDSARESAAASSESESSARLGSVTHLEPAPLVPGANVVQVAEEYISLPSSQYHELMLLAQQQTAPVVSELIIEQPSLAAEPSCDFSDQPSLAAEPSCDFAVAGPSGVSAPLSHANPLLPSEQVPPGPVVAPPVEDRSDPSPQSSLEDERQFLTAQLQFFKGEWMSAKARGESPSLGIIKSFCELKTQLAALPSTSDPPSLHQPSHPATSSLHSTRPNDPPRPSTSGLGIAPPKSYHQRRPVPEWDCPGTSFSQAGGDSGKRRRRDSGDSGKRRRPDASESSDRRHYGYGDAGKRRRRDSSDDSSSASARRRTEEEDQPSREEEDVEDSTQDHGTLADVLRFINEAFEESRAPATTASHVQTGLLCMLGEQAKPPASSSRLAWSRSFKAAFNQVEEKLRSRLKEDRSVNSLLPSVSSVERVADSAAQGRELKADSAFFDLVDGQHKESHQGEFSFKDMASLERTLRGSMESFSFFTWLMTGFFAYVKRTTDIDFSNPFMSQMISAFDRNCTNLSSSLSYATGFVTLRRRQSHIRNLFRSVTKAQKRDLLLDSLFLQPGLFSATTVAKTKESARDVVVYQKGQPAASSSGYRSVGSFKSAAKNRGRFSSSSTSSSQHKAAPKRFFAPRRGGRGKGKTPHQKGGKNFRK